MQKVKKLSEKIAKEHYGISKDLDLSNLSYLWFMYAEGSKQGSFKPFIFLAEVNLLVRLNYLTSDEKRNIIGLMTSSDKDNLYMAALSISTLRKQRIRDLGEYTKNNIHYSDVVYQKEVLDPEDFLV
jgi:hypothetical protein